MSRSLLLPLLFALGGLAAAGCGGAARPKGQLFMNGQPYNLADGERVSITFSPIETGKEASSATVGKDGSFDANAKGLQPGSYAISVISSNANAPGADRYKDKFNNVFNGPSSPLKIDLESGSSPTIAIDLGAKTVTKK